MKRRNFILGLGATAAGGSAILGSGAFSRVESHRSVTIEVAEDPNAYLGLDKCDTPNGSYAHLDDHGHLKIYMDDENPTIGESPLGEGINSNSTTWFDRVFQICNQGKEDACVWISDDENWPVVPEGETDEGERRVEFYQEDDDGASLIGEENAILLGLGECLCVGIKVRSYGLEDGDKALDELDNTIQINADVDGDCRRTPPEELSCDLYGITLGTDPADLKPIEVPAVETGSTIIGLDNDGQNYPNGLAYDTTNGVWYFADSDGQLYTTDGDDVTEYDDGSIADGAVAGAAWGSYYFIPQGSSQLKTAEIDNVGDPTSDVDVEDVADLSAAGGSLNLGDLAIDGETLYVSTVNPGNFFSVDLSDNTVDVIATGGPAVGKQIAFGIDSTGSTQLYAHDANDGSWYGIDETDGTGDLIGETERFTDLAQCDAPFMELPPEIRD